MMVEDQLVVHEVFGIAVGRCLVIFYTDGDVVVSLDL